MVEAGRGWTVEARRCVCVRVYVCVCVHVCVVNFAFMCTIPEVASTYAFHRMMQLDLHPQQQSDSNRDP